MADKRIGSIKLSRLWRYCVLMLLCSFLALWFTAPPVAMAGPAAPNTDGELNLVGKYQLSIEYKGTRTPHDLELTGSASGNGGQPAGGPYTKKWHITGSVPPAPGQDFHWVIVYDSGVGAVGTTMHMVGTIQSDGSLQGTWWDNDQGRRRDGSWNTTSGHASRSRTKSLAPPSAANPPTAQEIVGMWQGKARMLGTLDRATGKFAIYIKSDGTLDMKNPQKNITTTIKYRYSNGRIESDWTSANGKDHFVRIIGDITNTSSGLSLDLAVFAKMDSNSEQFIFMSMILTKVSGDNSVTAPNPQTNADASKVSEDNSVSVPQPETNADASGNAPGMGDVGSVPGPENSTQGAVGLLLPALIGVLGGSLSGGLGGLLGGTDPDPSSEPSPEPPPPGSPYGSDNQQYKPATFYGTGTAADPFRDRNAIKVNKDGTISGYNGSTVDPTISGDGTSINPYSNIPPPSDTDTSSDDPGSSSDPSPEPPPPGSPYGSDYGNAVKDRNESLDELEKMKKQWEESELTADKNDPNYEKLKKQYSDYMEYLKNKADAADAQANAIAQDAVTKANTKVLHGKDGRDYTIVYDPTKGTWKNAETGNDFDPDRFEQWQKELAADKEFSEKEREKMSNRQDAFSKEMDNMVAEQKKKAAAIQELTRLGKAALDRDMWNPGGPGNVYGKTQDLLDDIYAGKPIDEKAISQVRKIMNDRITGKTADGSSLDNPENQDQLSDTLTKAGLSTMEEVITCQDADGNISLTAVGARIVAGIATGGASEGAYVLTNMAYSARDAINKGGDDLDALEAGAITGAKESLAILAGHFVPAAGAKYLPTNVTAGIGEMLQPVAKGVAAADSAVQKGSKALANRISKTLTPVKELPEHLAGTRAAVTRVLESESPAELAKLYSKGGMKKLAELQKLGHLSEEEAKILNARLTNQVNKNIDNAMKDTIDQFEARTAVKVKSSILADSGSSAKPGGNPKIKTDFDRTSVTKFDNDDLQRYANAKGVTVEQANAELQQKFSNSLTDNVDIHLRNNGYARSISDVDYNTYTGIGKSAGKADAYPAGFTGMRQSVQGTGTAYERGAEGFVKSHKISGQAVVDQHVLNTAELKGELLPKDMPDPTKFHASEFRDFSEQQVKSVAKYSDVKSLAKAMGRQNDLARQMDNLATSPYSSHVNELVSENLPVAPPRMDPDVVKVVNKINRNPSDALTILTENGHTEDTFAKAVRENVNYFNEGLKG